MIEAARGATADDLPRLVDLAAALRTELHEMRGGPLWEVRESRVTPTIEAFTVLLDRTDTAVLVGTIDDAVIAYGTLEVEQLRDGTSLAVIGDIYVEPEARAVSIGEMLAEALVAFAVSAGCIGVDAFALPGHREAKNFFERNGFTARALVMHKRLSAS